MPADDLPLFCSSLSICDSHNPCWFMLKIGPLPVFIMWSDIGSKMFQILISSNHVVADPAIMNNIADSLTWLLSFEAPHLLQVSYHGIAQSFHLVCEFRSLAHIHPLDAH
jgi:hypothetical protein